MPPADIEADMPAILRNETPESRGFVTTNVMDIKADIPNEVSVMIPYDRYGQSYDTQPRQQLARPATQ